MTLPPTLSPTLFSPPSLQYVVLALFNGFNFFQMPSYPPKAGDLNLRRGITFISLIAMTINNLAQARRMLSNDISD